MRWDGATGEGGIGERAVVVVGVEEREGRLVESAFCAFFFIRRCRNMMFLQVYDNLPPIRLFAQSILSDSVGNCVSTMSS